MKPLRLLNKILASLIIIAVFFLVVGAAYSYYVARLSGQETDTTITGKTGHMELEYTGGPEIEAEDIAPSKDPFITKIFTIKGTNTTDADMWYKISLIIDENTFSNNTISYTLTGTNTAGNGSLVSDITTRLGLSTSNQVIGYGKYNGKINQGVHSYELKFYFYETDYDQLGDLGKNFRSHILVENNIPPQLKDKILGENNANVTVPLTAPGKAISTVGEAVLASAEDDYGTSYYFRGAVTNNYVLFADMCWRIVRVNGDGSIKLVLYNYNKGVNSCLQTGASYAFARYSGTTYTTAFNASYNRNAYVGFKYGTPGSGTYVAEHANTNKSTILTNLETWYTNNLASYANKLADSIWCNDKSTTATGSYGTLGYGTNQTGYALKRLGYNGSGWDYTTAAPTLKCSNDSSSENLSRFTVADTANGNGNLTYKIGLLTVDEAAYAGAMYSTANSTYYLNQNATDNHWWSLSPSNFNVSYASVWGVYSAGSLGYNVVDGAYGLRPAVSLISATQVTGVGTSSNPYVVL